MSDIRFHKGRAVCPNLRAECMFLFPSDNFEKLYMELKNTNQLDKRAVIDRYYLYFLREYPVARVYINSPDYLAVCKDCWKDFLMYRLAREGV